LNVLPARSDLRNSTDNGRETGLRAAEQRRGPRLPSRARVFCRPASGVLGQAGWPVAVRDLSCEGICLLLPCPLALGSILEFDVEAAHWSGFVTLRVRVVNARPEPDGYWRTGCVFLDRPGPNELKALRYPVCAPGPTPTTAGGSSA
jgi:hypothetical protein